MNKVCITTVVDEHYAAYIPLFCWCVKQVYPAYSCKIFTRNIDVIQNLFLNTEFIPLFEDFPRYSYNTIALRFVIPPKYFDKFDYVYVTDIDMMIMPERISIEDFHCGEMVSTGLPYSNSLRNVHHYAGYQSLSGLHFASRAWFMKTEAERLKYYDLLQRGLVGLYREYDGIMLYRMARNSGLGIPKKYKLKKRHHGIHLGNFRLYNTREAWESRIPPEYRSQWQSWECDPEFSEIIKHCRIKNKMLDNQLTTLHDFIRNPGI
jgi:hypothetical protein